MFGDELILTDAFEDQQTFERGEFFDVEESDAEIDPKALLGYWLDVEAGDNESFTFKRDGTGIYTWKEETYAFRYEVDDDRIDIYYEDGDTACFYWGVEDDVLNFYGNGIDWYLERQ